jgi:hypothetical protein
VSGCTGVYAKPAWQNSFGSASARELPDVSLFASNGFDGSAWFLCASGIGGDQAGQQDCTTPASGSIVNGTYSTYQVVGGTSASSPAFAGLLALVIQNLQSGGAANVRLGQADYTLYPLAQQHAAAFHDVTTGNDSVVCTAGTPNCGANGFLSGYNASAGYDLATGLGSVDATQMVQNWSSTTLKSSTTSLTVNGSTAPVTIQHGLPVSIGVTVAGSGGTPTGDVALVASGGNVAAAAAAVQSTVPSPSVLALTNGAATNGSYIYLPGGTNYSLAASYGGDGIFGPSVSTPPITVTVTPEPSTLDLIIQSFAVSNSQGAPVTSVPYGTYVSVAAEPFSAAQASAPQTPTYLLQATGTVTFSSTPAFAPLNRTVSVNSNGFAEVPGQLTLAYPPGAYSVSASYSGDPSFGKSTATGTFTITKNNVSISSANGSTAGTVLVEVDPTFSNLFSNSGLTLPTGTITLTNSAGATVGTGALSVVNTSNGTAAQATITVSGTAATVSYPGDTNYNSSTATFGGGGSASFTLTSAPTAVTVPSGGSASTTVSITPQGGFSGTVTVSCAVTGTGTPPPTCTLAQTSVALSGTAAVADKLTVATQNSAALHIPANPSDRTWYAAGGVALAGILLFGLPGRRRNWQRMLSLMLLVIAIGIAGCGGGSSGGGGGGSTPSGSYTVTVTATSGSAVQTSTITATVQ